jgi:formylglycine-generating enzyme required for sulfatase activity
MLLCAIALSIFPTLAAADSQIETGVARTVAAPAQAEKQSAFKTVDLGDNVKLELAEIPAGKFTMGAIETPPEPRWIGYSILGGGAGVAALLIAVMVIRSIRERERPRFSLLWYTTLVLALGTTMMGVQRTMQAARTWTEYRVRDDEVPAHPVEISKPFLMSRCEITQEQFFKIMDSNPSFFKNEVSARAPVDRVTWDEAVQFCQKLSERTKQTFRLPTEAEWEYACRAGTRSRFYFGNEDRDLSTAAWNNANSTNSTHPVGQLAPNAWGLCDMHGNVMEWCQDWYSGQYYASSPLVNPPGPASGETRVLRGGAWLSEVNGCRDSSRFFSAPDARSYVVGFRIVMEP